MTIASSDAMRKSLPGFDRAEALRDLIAERHSCRAYLSAAVSRETVEQMVSTAANAASWCNSQPWGLIVADKAETDRFRAGLYDYAVACGYPDHRVARNTSDLPFPAEYVGRYKERQWACGWALYDSLGIAFGDRSASAAQTMENYKLFGAPHIMIVTSDRTLGAYGAMDCGGFAAMLMLTARSLGIGTIAQAALAACSEFIRDFFGIPDDRIILFGISFGYADLEATINKFRTSRAPIKETLVWRETGTASG